MTGSEHRFETRARVYNRAVPEENRWVWECQACAWSHSVSRREFVEGINNAAIFEQADRLARRHLEESHGA